MSFDSQALFFQTDLTNWNTSFPVELINKCIEPPIHNIQCNIFLRKFFPPDKLMGQFSHKKSQKYPWKMEISPDGLFIIILKNNNLEMRSSKLDFSHTNFQCQIYRDMYPQWRCVSWSNLSNYFGVTFSNGMCNIWDTQGSRLVFKYMKLNEFDPVIKLVMVNIVKGKIRVYILTLKGRVFIYVIQNLKLLSSNEANIDFLSTPILCAEISFSGNLLVLGTYNQHNTNHAFKNGIISCRFIDESPFVVSNIACSNMSRGKQSWIYSLFVKKPTDGVYSIKISKDNDKLAALHLSGDLSIWLFPSLKFLLKWNVGCSPNLTNPILIPPDSLKRRLLPPDYDNKSIMEICWWNSDFVVVAIQNGRIIILDSDQSEKGNINLYPFPQIQESIEKSFFALNCIPKSKETEPGRIVDSRSRSWGKYLFGVVRFLLQDTDTNSKNAKKTANNVNDVEMSPFHFQLSCFQLTTPEELFAIQIDKKQYSDALELAHKYELDVDIVFQKQWRDSNKSIADIGNILIKIRKRNWILNECLERIPNELDSLKCLLRLGLTLTAISHLQRIRTDKETDNDEPIEFEIDDEFATRQQIVCELDPDQLDLRQIELVRIRLKLLGYWDKLSMYEEIIHSSRTQFRRELFEEFKNLSPFELGISFANSGNLIGLRVLFDYYISELGEHVLPILSNIPECLEPKSYWHLFEYLPNSPDWRVKLRFAPDWCECDQFAEINRQIAVTNEARELYYENHRDQRRFLWNMSTDSEHTNRQSILTNWIHQRIRNIEESTLNVGYALDLVRIAQQQLQITVDSELEFNLRFLCDAVYNCQIANAFVGLAQFESLTNVDKARLLMSKTDSDGSRFLIDFVHWIIPFSQEIHRKSTRQSLEFFRRYLPDIGRNSIANVKKLLADRVCVDTLLKMMDFTDFVDIFIRILLDDEQFANLEDCAKIGTLLSSLITDRQIADPDRYLSEQRQLEQIDKYIRVLRLLAKYELEKSIQFVHRYKTDCTTVENLITRMVWRFWKKTGRNLTKPVVKSIFGEIEIVVSLVFNSIQSKLIYGNLIQSLLESGDKRQIRLACEFMDLSGKLSTVINEDILLDFPESVRCIVTAVRNYIDNSTSSSDSNFKLGKYCLNLVANPTSISDIAAEFDIIHGCEFLDTHHHQRSPIVPIELRRMDNRFPLLKSCLDSNKQLYRSLEIVVEAGTFLCADDNFDRKYHEGEALRLLAEHATANNDMEILEIVMASLVHRNHRPCWRECIDCLKNPNFTVDRKYELGMFAVTNCPKSELHQTMTLMRKIEIADVHVSDNSNSTPLSIDSNTNSNPIKQPIRFISDISTKLSLKSLIDKSSESLMKLSNQMIELGGSFYNDFHWRNSLDGISNPTDDQFDADYRQLIRVFILSTVGSHTESEIDDLHFKLAKFNLRRDPLLAIVHSLFVTDIGAIHGLRHELTPNLFSRALILSMIQFNLIFKYTSQLPLGKIGTKELDSIIKPIMRQMTENELSVLESMQQEFQDYSLLDNISSIFPDICNRKFFSSVDYRRELIFKLCEFHDNIDCFRYSLLLSDRYGIDRRVVSLKYLFSFVTKNRILEKIDFEENYAHFQQSGFDWNYLLNEPIAFGQDLESFFTNDESNRMGEFRILLRLLERVNRDFVIFERTVAEHIRWVELYDSIFEKCRQNCDYLDFFNGCHGRIIGALKHVVNTDNLDLCSSLMREFKLTDEFTKIQKQFSIVLANQTLWSPGDDKHDTNSLRDRFTKSLRNFSLSDCDNCKDFMHSTLFEKSHSHIDLETKLVLLEIAQVFVEEMCNSPRSRTGWPNVNIEITIWRDHIENTVKKVVDQLNSLGNMSREIVGIAEYLPPENYWDCLLNEMLLAAIGYQDFFSFTWDLNIESIIVEEAIAVHISHIAFSRHIPGDAIVDKLTQIFEDLDEFLDSDPTENIISLVLVQSNREQSRTEIVQWLLNEFVYRIRQNKSSCYTTADLAVHIISIMSRWELPINKHWQISNTDNLFIVDALIQDCDGPERMALVGQAIELIELVHEDNHLWQCWVKSCVVKGVAYSGLVFEQFCRLQTNRLYKVRLPRLMKDAVQSLTALNAAEAISLLIVKDPIESVESIQTILSNLKSDPMEYATTMKNINAKALKVIVDQKLIPLYAKSILFQRLVNFITKDNDDPSTVQNVLEQLKQNGLRDEATWLASSSNHINPAQKTIEMVSGFWKRFSTGGSS